MNILDQIWEVTNGKLPLKGITIGEYNYSDYMGYLCEWHGTTPVIVCSMLHFSRYRPDNRNINETRNQPS